MQSSSASLPPPSACLVFPCFPPSSILPSSNWQPQDNGFLTNTLMAFFTPQNAKAYRQKSLASYRRNRILEKQRAEREALAAFLPPLPPPQPVPLPPPLPPPQQKDLCDFCEKRIARVRGMLDKLDTLMEKERDPQKLDRLASAQMRLSEQERIMSGRPLPGSRRPIKERPHPNGSTTEQLTPE